MTRCSAARQRSTPGHDIEAIRQLRRRYAYGITRGLLDDLDDVFAAEAHITTPQGTMYGLPAIKWGLEQGCGLAAHLSGRLLPFQGALVRHDIDLTGEDSATGRCYFIDYDAPRSPAAGTAILLKVYHDDYRIVSGKWRIIGTVIKRAEPHDMRILSAGQHAPSSNNPGHQEDLTSPLKSTAW